MSDRVKTTDTEVKTHQHGMTGSFGLVRCDPEKISDDLFTQANFIFNTGAIFICRFLFSLNKRKAHLAPVFTILRSESVTLSSKNNMSLISSQVQSAKTIIIHIIKCPSS